MTSYPSHSERWIDVSGPESEVLVVLIHGSLDRSAGMARLSRLSSRTHRTIRFDRRGYGRHLDHPGPFSVSANADDVVSLVGHSPAILIGHSFGGNVALAVAERLGTQILGVSTYETPLSWFDWWPRDSAGGEALRVDPQDAAETFMIRMIGEKRWNDLPEATRQQRRSEGRALTGELGDLRKSAPWDADKIASRVLCGRGTKAAPHHAMAAGRLASILKNAEEVILEGAGHGAPISHPQEFFDFLIAPHFGGTT